MASPTSSTACRLWRENRPPILKCLVSSSVRSSGPALAPGSAAGLAWPSRRVAGSPMTGPFPVMQEAPDQRAIDRVQLGWRLRAAAHDLVAARGEPAAGRDPGQIGRAAGNPGLRYPRPPDRRERLHQPDAIGV